jgi:hypothetical protein
VEKQEGIALQNTKKIKVLRILIMIGLCPFLFGVAVIAFSFYLHQVRGVSGDGLLFSVVFVLTYLLSALFLVPSLLNLAWLSWKEQNQFIWTSGKLYFFALLLLILPLTIYLLPYIYHLLLLVGAVSS